MKTLQIEIYQTEPETAGSGRRDKPVVSINSIHRFLEIFTYQNLGFRTLGYKYSAPHCEKDTANWIMAARNEINRVTLMQDEIEIVKWNASKEHPFCEAELQVASHGCLWPERRQVIHNKHRYKIGAEQTHDGPNQGTMDGSLFNEVIIGTQGGDDAPSEGVEIRRWLAAAHAANVTLARFKCNPVPVGVVETM